ncbi:MAG: ATP-dependent helicase [Clostridioides sp.]|jgi:DNA helicase-2/ATP-dependent DNA helicase PcrA|nr:ATP-dependent helicase [Clostridioides sp.]
MKIIYRKDQFPIMQYESGTMAIPAVPGAGKTFIVTNLVAKLILENMIDGKKILILTYMNSAANNFKGRIKKILEETHSNSEIMNKILDNSYSSIKNSYEVMTIHSLAIKIIKENPESVMLSDDFNIADDLQKNIILNSCIEKFILNNGENIFNDFLIEQKNANSQRKSLEQFQKDFFGIVGNAISQLKFNTITPEKLEYYFEVINEEKSKSDLNEVNSINEEKSKSYLHEINAEKMKRNGLEFLKIVYPIYLEYEKKLKINGLLDYDDILILAVEVLEKDTKLRKKFQDKYRYIFEDECQDSNKIQGKIIKILSENNNNLVRVGDINQSITGTFSSSDPKLFRKFIEESDYCYRMNMANRSSEDIIDIANHLVEFVNKNFSQKESRDALDYMKIEPVEKGKGYKENPVTDSYYINTKTYLTWQEEVERTVKYAKGINKKFPDKTIGILVPFNSHIAAIAEEMNKNNMIFEELGSNSAKKRKIIDNISQIIDFIINCDDTDKLLNNILSEIFLKDIENQNKEKIISSLKELNLNTEEIIYGSEEVYKSIQKKINDKYLYNLFIKFVSKMKDILSINRLRFDTLVLSIGNLIEEDIFQKAIVDYIAFYIQLMSIDKKNLSLLDIYNLLVDKKNKVFTFILDVVYEKDGYEPKAGSVTICNYHKSKGLEWDCVFLLGLTKYYFPDNIYDKIQGEKWFLKENYKNPIAKIKCEIDTILSYEKKKKINELEFEFKNEINKLQYEEICELNQSNNEEKSEKNYLIDERISIINEKIRLLYVGITRAKDMLIMSYSAFSRKEDVNNSKRKQEASEFFTEISEFVAKKKM